MALARRSYAPPKQPSSTSLANLSHTQARTRARVSETSAHACEHTHTQSHTHAITRARTTARFKRAQSEKNTHRHTAPPPPPSCQIHPTRWCTRSLGIKRSPPCPRARTHRSHSSRPSNHNSGLCFNPRQRQPRQTVSEHELRPTCGLAAASQHARRLGVRQVRTRALAASTMTATVTATAHTAAFLALAAAAAATTFCCTRRSLESDDPPAYFAVCTSAHSAALASVSLTSAHIHVLSCSAARPTCARSTEWMKKCEGSTALTVKHCRRHNETNQPENERACACHRSCRAITSTRCGALQRRWPRRSIVTAFQRALSLCVRRLRRRR